MTMAAVVFCNCILLISFCCFLTIKAIDICQTTDVFHTRKDGDDSFFVSSPNYPNGYPGPRNCTLIIHCPRRTFFMIDIHDVSMKENSDFLTITIPNRLHVNFPPVVQKLTGKYNISASNPMIQLHGVPFRENITFFFHTEGNTTATEYKGFKIEYYFIHVNKL